MQPQNINIAQAQRLPLCNFGPASASRVSHSTAEIFILFCSILFCAHCQTICKTNCSPLLFYFIFFFFAFHSLPVRASFFHPSFPVVLSVKFNYSASSDKRGLDRVRGRGNYLNSCRAQIPHTANGLRMRFQLRKKQSEKTTQ